MGDTMTCPRCGGTMQTFERAGVQVDQCSSCRGIFLDRGELEQLINAEQAYSRPSQPQSAGYPPQRSYPPGYDYEGHHDYDEHHGYGRRGLFHHLFEDD